MYINLKMLINPLKKFSLLLLFFLIFINSANSEIIKKIEILGNERIPDETILMFSKIQLNQDVKQLEINNLLKNIYNSNFFEDVTVNLENNVLIINVKEFPIIEDIVIKGIKAKKIKKSISDSLKLKPRSSYDKFLLAKDKQNIKDTLKSLGYYSSTIKIEEEITKNNTVLLNYTIELGEKAKIKKISFIGNKIFKDNKLKSLIISEEYKFWKFISGKKFLNQEMVEFDKKLLKNYYLNKGYLNVEINSSFAKLLNKNEFEIIYNIESNEKIFFGNLNYIIPKDFTDSNFSSLNDIFLKLKETPYSLNKVNKILEEIDKITTNEEYQSIKASVVEEIEKNKINLTFLIEETDKFIVEKINIFGNNVTKEEVIRNQFEVDEGDFYNEILQTKSINNLKSLNFFREVKSEVIKGSDEKSKVINIEVVEKATGEIFAGAGFGTAGGTISAGVRENNFLGKGIALNSNLTINENSIKGLFGVSNRNFRNTDKSIYANLQSSDFDRLKTSGYKSSKTGFEVGTQFEYLDDLNLGLSTSSFYEKIETDSNASTTMQSQEGDYWDTFLKVNFNYDKRDQKFKTSDGFQSFYSINLPLISDNNTITNTYNYKYFTELYENNLSKFSLYLQSANSITGDDIKLSERLKIPASKLRGFEYGKVGPKEGDDYVGGNFVSSLNFSSTVPKILENVQSADMLFLIDIANVWGVDYDSSLNDDGKIRSSISLGLDWYSAIGPLNFTFSEVLSKDSNDTTETFRFNIGTTF